ncbi:MAG: hypothetical protein LN415_09940, partial [Candidatus Thermoplasmatota archaeon]|nr:hypothetical protein [Candidatus Thermoplasmatota archaeon]
GLRASSSGIDTSLGSNKPEWDNKFLDGDFRANPLQSENNKYRRSDLGLHSIYLCAIVRERPVARMSTKIS